MQHVILEVLPGFRLTQGCRLYRVHTTTTTHPATQPEIKAKSSVKRDCAENTNTHMVVHLTRVALSSVWVPVEVRYTYGQHFRSNSGSLNHDLYLLGSDLVQFHEESKGLLFTTVRHGQVASPRLLSLSRKVQIVDRSHHALLKYPTHSLVSFMPDLSWFYSSFNSSKTYITLSLRWCWSLGKI